MTEGVPAANVERKRIDQQDESPGTQSLVRVTSGESPLTALPSRAYENLLVLATKSQPNRIERRLADDGRNLQNVGVVPVAPVEANYGGDLWTTDSVQPGDLTGIGMRFSDALEHVERNSGWVLIDALSVLFMYSDDLRVCRFFQTLAGRARARGVQGVYCVNPTAVGEETYERLRGLCDVECGMA